ncbi:MAG: hypothetical protein QGI21_00690 [Candidatus Poseidoniaceae archaeon]|jgi:hypothetical protein|nr:hypothetical protein [Candidatus Poseidoniaceae archaeon]
MSELSKRKAMLSLFSGFFLIWIGPIFKLVSGNNISNALWPLAIDTLEWSFILRENREIYFAICIISLALIISIGKINNKYLRMLGIGIIGSVLGFLSVFFLLDAAYLRGAFVLLPSIYGFIILNIITALNGIPKIDIKNKDWSLNNIGNLLLIVFAIYLITPGIGPFLGISPEPPAYPSHLGGDVEFETTIHQYPMPVEVEDIRGEIEGDIDFSIYLSLPSQSIGRIPLAIILHGFANPDFASYQDWIETLASKGMAVAFIQYPSDVMPEGWDTYVLEEKQGMSNHPYHVPRAIAIESALDYLTTITPNYVDYSNLLVSGHSLGAGYALLVLDSALERGWANQSLVIDLEAPYARPVQSHLQVNFTGLPDNFIAHIAVSEDDMSVNDCFAVYHSEILGDKALMLKIPSDRHGFPRLVASHYLQATQTHDSLADWGFYRRIASQADWLNANIDGNLEEITEAHQKLIDSNENRFMGYWEDGTPVNEIKTWVNPLDSNEYEYCKTWIGN